MKKVLMTLLVSLWVLVTASACDREAYGFDISREAPSTSLIDATHPAIAPQIYLMVFMWVDNQWIPGWEIPGYNPIEQESISQCLTGAEVLNGIGAQDVQLDDGTKLHVEKFRGRCLVVVPWDRTH